MKRPDPHEEALMILKGQMSQAVATPGTQVRGRVGLGPSRREEKVGPPGEPQKSAAPISCGPAAVLINGAHFLPTEHSLWGGDRYPERLWPW